MDDQDVTNPAPVEAQEVTPAEAVEADQPENEDELTSDTEGQEEAPAAEDEFDDFEDEDGKKYRVPKAIVPKLMMQRDYTQKTQGLAEERRQVEARAQEQEQTFRMREELFQESAQLHNVEQRLNAYRNVNWQAWQAQDPQGAQAALAEYTTLRDVHANLQGQIRHKASELNANREREAANLKQRAIEHLSKPNPMTGWDGKFDGAKSETLTKFGMQIGFSLDELSSTTHPLMIQTLNLAKIGYDYLQKQRTAPKGPAPVPAAKAPVARSPQVTTDPNKMSFEQYKQARQKGLVK